MQQNTPSPQNGHIAMLNYRVNAIEQALKSLHAQLQAYVPKSENDLQLKAIYETMKRIEAAVVDPDSGLQRQVLDQKTNLDRLQIRILWGMVSGFGSLIAMIIIGIAVFYFTHLP